MFSHRKAFGLGLFFAVLIGFFWVYTQAQGHPDVEYETPDYESMRPEASGFLSVNSKGENASLMVNFENTGDIAYNISNMEWHYWTEETGVFVDYEGLPEKWKRNSSDCVTTESDREDGILSSGERMEHCLNVSFPYRSAFGVAIHMERYESTLYLSCDSSEQRRLSCLGDIVYNRSEVDLDLEGPAEQVFS